MHNILYRTTPHIQLLYYFIVIGSVWFGMLFLNVATKPYKSQCQMRIYQLIVYITVVTLHCVITHYYTYGLHIEKKAPEYA